MSTLPPGVVAVLPTAPTVPVTINGGAACPSWYDIAGLDASAGFDTPGMDAAGGAIVALLEAEAEKVGWENVALMGFSQGGVVTYHTLLTQGAIPSRMGAAIVLSGYLPRVDPLDVLDADAMDDADVKKTPIFIGHGTYDAVVGFKWGKASKDALVAAKYPVTWQEYDGMGHSFCDQEFVDVKTFLLQNLPALAAAADA